jgi:hypothetical protein
LNNHPPFLFPQGGGLGWRSCGLPLGQRVELCLGIRLEDRCLSASLPGQEFVGGNLFEREGLADGEDFTEFGDAVYDFFGHLLPRY